MFTVADNAITPRKTEVVVNDFIWVGLFFYTTVLIKLAERDGGNSEQKIPGKGARG